MINRFLILILLISLPGLAEEEINPALSSLYSAKTLRCAFPEGTQAEFKGESIEKTASSMDSLIIFDSINVESGTARMIGNVGAVDVTATISFHGVSFLEVTDTGNIVITTAYVGDSITLFPAVMSRHLTILQVPFPSQQYGWCEIFSTE